MGCDKEEGMMGNHSLKAAVQPCVESMMRSQTLMQQSLPCMMTSSSGSSLLMEQRHA